MHYLLFFFVLTGNIINICGQNENEDGELVFVAILFRHGARSPIMNIPGDNQSYWMNGTGQLTWRGKGESYVLGSLLRDRYVGDNKLVPQNLNISQVHCQSSGYDRTLMTMQLVLASMFPPVTLQDWNPALQWQPIPIHSSQPEYDYPLLGFNDGSCARLSEIMQDMHDSEDYVKLHTKYDKFLSELSNKIGVRLDLHAGTNLYDSLNCEKYEGLQIPILFNESDLKTLEDLFVDYWTFHINTNNMELKRISSGALWSMILENMEYISKKIVESNTLDDFYTKIFMLSAHDTTILHFLNLLGFKNNSWPKFNAYIKLEMYNVSNRAFVKVLYENRNEERILRFPFCNNQDMCDFSILLKELGSLRSVDRQSECRSGVIPPTTTTVTTTTTSSPATIPDLYKNQRIAMWIFIIINTVLLIGLAAYMLRRRFRRAAQGYTAIG